ncbi:hypothetical protein [Serratia sp. Ag2]|uniref:hypothetical protein n=1 Tax=Serratia sp. Ag2 TaxID=1532556 RepID=UPI00050488BC|nr:hypothetical protein [Serratia sp. Ag2]KFK95935.1 copper resistance protein [Serratia sp. Ag2]
MKKMIMITVLSTLSIGTALATTSEQALNAHRFVNNASADSHVSASTHHKEVSANVKKDIAKSFSEMNEHERAIVALSFTKNSSSYANQQAIEYHKKMLKQTESKPDPVSYSDLNAADRAALVHEQGNNAAAPVHQLEAERIRASYKK